MIERIGREVEQANRRIETASSIEGVGASVLARAVLNPLLETRTHVQINQAFIDLSEGLQDIAQVDGESGVVRVDDALVRRAVASTLPPEAGAPMLAALRRQYSSGMAIVNGEPLIPWSMLRDPDSVHLLGSGGLRALGLRSVLPDNEIAVELGASYRNAPMTDLQNRAVLEAIRGQLELAARPRDGSGLPGEEPPPPPPPLPPDMKVIVEETVRCFGTASWNANWWGFSVDFDRPCADHLQNSLSAALFPPTIAAISAGVAAGGTIAAMAGPAVAAIGGLVVAGIVAVGLSIILFIELNKTSRGVALQSFWVPPFIWAKGL